MYNSNAPYSRVETAFYAIKWHYDSSPLVHRNPCVMKFIQLVLAGIKRMPARPVTRKEPISTEILRKIVNNFGRDDNLMNIRNCTMFLISFAGFLRYDEVANLRQRDIELNPSHVKLFLVKSKTDQYREGAWVIIDATGSPLCPVSMLRRYLCLSGMDN